MDNSKADAEISKQKILDGRIFMNQLQHEIQRNCEDLEEELSVLQEKQKELKKRKESMKALSEDAGTLFMPGRYERSMAELEECRIEEEKLKQREETTQGLLQQKMIQKQSISQVLNCIEYLYTKEEEENQTAEENELEEISADTEPVEGDDKSGEYGSSGRMQKESILEIQEMERKRIARDLHDSAVQNLAALVHKTEFVEKLIDIDMMRAKMELSAIQDTIRKSIEEIRSTIYNLHPMQIHDLGLIATLERFVRQLSDESGLAVRFHSIGEDCDNTTISLAMFRVVQEACNNSVRYAKASQIIVEYKNENQTIQLIIRDNGIGFDREESQKKAIAEGRGFGLSVMEERVYLLSGKLDLESKKGSGTTITVTVPYVNEVLDSLR